MYDLNNVLARDRGDVTILKISFKFSNFLKGVGHQIYIISKFKIVYIILQGTQGFGTLGPKWSFNCQAQLQLQLQLEVESCYSISINFISTPTQPPTRRKSLKITFNFNFNYNFYYNFNSKL